MRTTEIRNERDIIIGFAEENGGVITYRHLTKGLVGYYDTRTKVYTRMMSIPGRPVHVQAGTGDYGESDLRYWG